jgi:hypothetical protein
MTPARWLYLILLVFVVLIMHECWSTEHGIGPVEEPAARVSSPR